MGQHRGCLSSYIRSPIFDCIRASFSSRQDETGWSLWLWMSLGRWIFLACSLSHPIPSIYIVNPTITKQYRSFYCVVNLKQIDPSWIDALLGEVCPIFVNFKLWMEVIFNMRYRAELSILFPMCVVGLTQTYDRLRAFALISIFFWCIRKSLRF